jgi:CheY-like chemotaxis protein
MKDDPAAKILLVDDNDNGLQTRKLILIQNGYSVETALSGEAAWEIFQKTHFDIVVTDYRMPRGMDGVELIRRIRASDSPARIIMLSGIAGRVGLTLEATGADELLAKSNKEVPELLRAIKKFSVRPRGRGAASARAARAVKARKLS